MDIPSLTQQLSAADSFTSGAWMLYGFSALGVIVAAWVLIRNKNIWLKTVFMSFIVFASLTIAPLEFDTGTLWVPAIPYLGVNIAFGGADAVPDVLPYLALSFVLSAIVCLSIALIGRRVVIKNPKPSEKTADNSAETA